MAAVLTAHLYTYVHGVACDDYKGRLIKTAECLQIIQSAGIEECRLQTVAAARHQPACCPGGRAGAARGGPGGHSFWGKLLVLTDTGWRGTRDTCAGHVTPSLLTVLGSHVSSMQARSPGERSQPRVIAVWAGYRLYGLRSPPPVCVYYRQSAAARRPGPRHPGSARRMRGARPGQLHRSLPPNFRGNYLYLGPRSCSSNHVTGGRAVEGCRGLLGPGSITSHHLTPNTPHTQHTISKI